MASHTKSWLVLITALILSSVQLCNSFKIPFRSTHLATQDVFSLKAGMDIDHEKDEEGEAHGKIRAPKGSKFASIKIGNDHGEVIAAFMSEDIVNATLEHAIIVIHGKRRDGDDYWKQMTRAVKKARKDDLPGSNREVAVIAPQFFSTIYNSGQYGDNQLAWADLNAWQPGGRATHPKNTTISSFDVLDGIMEVFSDYAEYPSLTNLTIVGHGGGGQLVQRYAAVGKDAPKHLHVRYIHGDPSSCAYFTDDRPHLKHLKYDKKSCPAFNTWRYGFHNFPGAAGQLKSPKEYFVQYATRDVVSIVGYEDESENGDTSCMAKMQGGDKRRDRNLVWYKYINALAGSDKGLDDFPGEFHDITDWSEEVKGTASLRLVVVEDVPHSFEQLFEKRIGQKALFSKRLDLGWRPLER